MKKFLLFLTFLTTLMLNGCSLLKKPSEPNMNSKPIHLQEYQKQCSPTEIEKGSCPSFTFDSLNFLKPKALNTIINSQLLKMLNAPDTDPIEDFLENSLAKANEGYHLAISTKLLSENDVLIVLELTVQERHFIDQYSPQKISIINFDKRKQKVIDLNSAILPDKTAAFWSTAELAYHNWLEAEQLLNNKDFQEDWPFKKTANIALLPQHVILKYNGNTIAPYAMGYPMLFISYDQLKDILKPEYQPH